MIFCEYCNTKLDDESSICEQCGLDASASENDKALHRSYLNRVQDKFEKALYGLQIARFVLFGIGIITLIFNFLKYHDGEINKSDFIVLCGLSIFIIIAAFLINFFPNAMVIMGIIFVLSIFLYSLYHAHYGILDHFPWKVLLFGLLIYSLDATNKFEKALKEVRKRSKN